MPADYGKLTPAQRRERNRQTAIKKRDALRAAEKKAAPVRGENAREKARTPVMERARETVHRIERGEDSRTAKQTLDRLKLTDAEKRDLGGYSKARSERTQRALARKTRRDLRSAADVTGIPQLLSDAKWSVTHPGDRLAGRGRAKGTPITYEGRQAYTSIGEFPGFSGKGTGAIGRKILGAVAPKTAAKRATKRAAAAAVPKPTGVFAARPKPRTPEEATARLDELEKTVEKHVDKVERYLRETNPSATYGKDTRVRRVMSDADRAKTHAIGTGTPIDEPLKVHRPQSGPAETRARAEKLLYERAKASKHPGMRKIAAAFDEMDELRAQVLRHKEGDVFGDPGAPPVDFGTSGMAPAPASVISEALPHAKRLRGQQEKLYSTERARRAAMAEEAMQVGGLEGYQAALRSLKGELPKLKFGALEHFDDATRDELLTHVQQLSDLRPYEKIGTQKALLKVIGGGVPTRGEIKMLHRTFGPEVVAKIAESVPLGAKARDFALNVLNVPRSIMASVDLSAPFRQGLVLGARHPRMFAREFAPMLKSFGSEGSYERVMDQIAARPTFDLMQRARVQLTDLQGLTDREEQFMSNFAENLTGGKRSPVRMSGRAYTAFLNKFRADVFDQYVTMAQQPYRSITGRKMPGVDFSDPTNPATEKVLRDIGRMINTSSGRGNAKQLEGAMRALNSVFFSPRLMLSRLQLLNPVYYASLSPFARRQAVQAIAHLVPAISLTLYLAKQAGAEVGVDPRSTDWGKIKVGDTRVDIAGGLQQYAVLATRLAKGETVSSTTGGVTELEGGFAKQSRWSVGGNFLENKLAPVPSLIGDLAQNENYSGDKIFTGDARENLRSVGKETGTRFMPLGLQNAYEGYKDSPRTGVASFGLSTIGFGVQTYGAGDAKKTTTKSLRGGSGPRGNSKSLRSGEKRKSKSLRD